MLAKHWLPADGNRLGGEGGLLMGGGECLGVLSLGNNRAQPGFAWLSRLAEVEGFEPGSPSDSHIWTPMDCCFVD
jgi:hypothetical protein